MKIYHLQHTEIDIKKWNECILNAYNGNVYAYSWYLDIVNENWEALVNEDYTCIMPLTIGRKYKIDYLYQPFFTQQLGVFSTKKLDSVTVELFIDSIPDKFKFYEINLNTFNKIQSCSCNLIPLKNYELDLIPTYEKLLQNYATNTKRNIKKAENNKITITTGLQPNVIIGLIKENLDNKTDKLRPHHYNMMRKIIAIATQYQFGESYGAYDSKNELCAVAYFVTSHNKSIFLFSGSNENGKNNGAMFKLIDFFIKKYAEKNLTLDFEGSSIDGLARLYAGFGAKACEYYRLRKNSLPWYIKFLKK